MGIAGRGLLIIRFMRHNARATYFRLFDPVAKSLCGGGTKDLDGGGDGDSLNVHWQLVVI